MNVDSDEFKHYYDLPPEEYDRRQNEEMDRNHRAYALRLEKERLEFEKQFGPIQKIPPLTHREQRDLDRKILKENEQSLNRWSEAYDHRRAQDKLWADYDDRCDKL